jgi:hypothetical protein
VRYVVIDVEASGFDGFPIKVGWCDQDGNSESHLIRPAWNWTDWDTRAVRQHGISRDLLKAQGEPHEVVAKLVADMLARCRREGIVVASDNPDYDPDYDREWLVRLLRRADIEDDGFVTNIPELYAVAVERLFAALPEDWHPGFKAAHQRARIRGDAIIQAAKPKHRASDDARRLRDIVETIKAEAIKAKDRESRQ